jgi:hypothetical protein
MQQEYEAAESLTHAEEAIPSILEEDIDSAIGMMLEGFLLRA